MSVCAKCNKSVGLAEGRKACNKIYHSSCFCCDGCGKKLSLASYVSHKNEPHCQSCPGRTGVISPIQAITGITGNGALIPSTQLHISDDVGSKSPRIADQDDYLKNVKFQELPEGPWPTVNLVANPSQQMHTSNIADDFYCGKCDKLLGIAEKVSCNGKSWHKECFICQYNGCGKKLCTLKFETNAGLAYCEPCFKRLPRSSKGQTKSVLPQQIEISVSYDTPNSSTWSI